MNKNTPERLTRWMLMHEQPEHLSLDHAVDENYWAGARKALSA